MSLYDTALQVLFWPFWEEYVYHLSIRDVLTIFLQVEGGWALKKLEADNLPFILQYILIAKMGEGRNGVGYSFSEYLTRTIAEVWPWTFVYQNF
jgi:hypothetical protein